MYPFITKKNQAQIPISCSGPNIVLIYYYLIDVTVSMLGYNTILMQPGLSIMDRKNNNFMAKIHRVKIKSFKIRHKTLIKLFIMFVSFFN